MEYSEIRKASLIGMERWLQDMERGLKQTYGRPQVGGLDESVCGCIVEFAVAKHYGLPWDGALGNFKAKDVGPLQVRGTYWRNGELILHDRDADADVFVLGTASLKPPTPFVDLQGWIIAREGKQKKYWQEKVKGRPAYFVPQDVLRDIHELKVERA